MILAWNLKISTSISMVRKKTLSVFPKLEMMLRNWVRTGRWLNQLMVTLKWAQKSSTAWTVNTVCGNYCCIKEGVNSIQKGLNPSKAVGPDQLRHRVLKISRYFKAQWHTVRTNNECQNCKMRKDSMCTKTNTKWKKSRLPLWKWRKIY